MGTQIAADRADSSYHSDNYEKDAPRNEMCTNSWMWNTFRGGLRCLGKRPWIQTVQLKVTQEKEPETVAVRI
ncbi:hypothetical protein RvY_11002 [Ramazzottius varieornatus]|uniref:Uncharacterized protein n=1 Tax=Ramazzottius varieornatus TaxID=947166 RepID=A0A1D1VH41_RAMVA|nr:hypothetical protein RvY_11002 [Ramazzottius varieornatus]